MLASPWNVESWNQILIVSRKFNVNVAFVFRVIRLSFPSHSFSFSFHMRPTVSYLLELIVAAQQHCFLVIILRDRSNSLMRSVSSLRRWYWHVLRIVWIEAGYPHVALSLWCSWLLHYIRYYRWQPSLNEQRKVMRISFPSLPEALLVALLIDYDAQLYAWFDKISLHTAWPTALSFSHDRSYVTQSSWFNDSCMLY